MYGTVIQNKQIYQIGNQRLTMLRVSLSDEPELVGRGEPTEVPFSPYPVWGDSRYLHEPVEIEVSGLLVDTSRQRAKQIAQGLRRMIDMPTDLIAYEPDTVLTWLHTIGVVHEVQLEQDDPFRPATLTIQLQLMAYWGPLNRLLWYFGSVPQHPLERTDAPGVHDPAPLPATGRVLNPNYADKEMWVRRNYRDYTFLYNPINWSMCGGGFEAVAWHHGGWFTLSVEQDVWNAPPRMLYGFTQLPTSGTLTMRVIRQAIWDSEEETITVDLAQLHADLDGGLRPADVLVIGDVSRLPGLVVRSRQVLDFTPRVNYSSRWPGFLAPGENRFFVDPAGGMFAYQAMLRKL